MEELKREEERAARLERLHRAHDESKRSKVAVKAMTKGTLESAEDQTQLVDRLMQSLDPFTDKGFLGTGAWGCSGERRVRVAAVWLLRLVAAVGGACVNVWVCMCVCVRV